MNIELSTGLDVFWQWDANLKLKVPDGIPEVHFRFGNKSKAYEVKDGWVSVPNELLQKADDIECWFYDSEHTMDFGHIEGRRRPKPDGYVYEETEFKSWTELDEKITKALEELEKTNTTLEEVKDEIGESLKFTEQELTNEQKVQSRKNIEVLSSEEVKNEIKDNTPSWEQNDSEGKGFIKNRPFYDTREAVLRSTYEDWVAAGGHYGNDEKPILSFIINNEIYEDVAPTVYNSGYTKVYNIPSYENRKYQIVAYTSTNPPSLKCIDARSNETVENWSIYPPKETGEIHYLDPKYIEDMYYTEKPKTVIEDLGKTYAAWLDIVGDSSYTDDYSKRKVSFKVNGDVYPDVAPSRYVSDGKVWVYNVNGTDIAAGSYMTNLSASDDSIEFSLVKISTIEEQIHKIPEKYYDTGAPFVITVTTINNDGTCEIDRTWDEIKEEFSKNTLPNHYIIIHPRAPFPAEVFMCNKTVSSGEITKILFNGQFFFSPIAGSVSDPSNGMLTDLYMEQCRLNITSTKTTFNFITGESNLLYNVTRRLNKNSNGEIYSDNLIFPVLQSINKDGLFMNSLARVTYNNEHYYFESAQVSDNSITAFFFSTTANGVYRRLKVTPGETENSEDIITIDKEINLNNPSNIMIIYPTATSSATAYPTAINKSYADIKEHLDNNKALFFFHRGAIEPLIDYSINDDTMVLTFVVPQYLDGQPHNVIEKLTITENGLKGYSTLSIETYKSFAVCMGDKKAYEFVGSTYDDVLKAYNLNFPSFVTFYGGTGEKIPVTLIKGTDEMILTGLLSENKQIVIRCDKDSQLTVYTNTLETPGNRVSEITEENSQTVTAYPNVAAVKSYVDEKVQGVISFDSLIVDELPKTGVKGVVYFVPHTHLWSNDSYDEYMWTGEKFEKIGNTDIDLTNYVKKDELPTKVSSFENDAGYLTEHQSLENYALKSEIPTVPTSLKNPNVLTIKVGNQTYTYDGSEAITIEIPDGSEVSY